MSIYQLLFESLMITFISYYVEAIFIPKHRSMRLNMEIVSEINHEILQFDTMIMFAISKNPNNNNFFSVNQVKHAAKCRLKLQRFPKANNLDKVEPTMP